MSIRTGVRPERIESWWANKHRLRASPTVIRLAFVGKYLKYRSCPNLPLAPTSSGLPYCPLSSKHHKKTVFTKEAFAYSFLHCGRKEKDWASSCSSRQCSTWNDVLDGLKRLIWDLTLSQGQPGHGQVMVYVCTSLDVTWSVRDCHRFWTSLSVNCRLWKNFAGLRCPIITLWRISGNIFRDTHQEQS